jgi:hypothetical protein
MSDARSIGTNTIEFFDTEAKVALNQEPLDESASVPRTGEILFLPAEMTGSKSGHYEVQQVEYDYVPSEHRDIPIELGPVKLNRIIVHVRTMRR